MTNVGDLIGGCRREEETYGWVCRCDVGGCDAVPDSQPSPPSINLFTSSKKNGPFEASQVQWTTKPLGGDDDATLLVQPSKRLQAMLGFGGAFTDAAGINIGRLPRPLQDDLIASYYHPSKGARYTIGRVPIASCDFSTHAYSYDDHAGDLNLSRFSLAIEDTLFKMPYIRKAKALVESGRRSLRLFGSPWSAPGWMKDSGRMAGKGSLLGHPGGPYYKAWARYFLKFLDAYAAANLSMWAVTVENEPTAGFVPGYAFQAMGLTAAMERDFVKLDLGPALAASPHNATQIIILDDQRLYIGAFTQTILGDPAAARYVSGVGLHWYMDNLSPVSLLEAAHNAYPDVFYLATEACAGAMPYEKRGVTLGNWYRARKYASDIMDDVSHWVGGWVDWNLALNISGGPNWVNNIVDAPIIVPDSVDRFYKQPMFYALAHFSAFVRDGYRIGQKFATTTKLVSAVSFVRSDGQLVAVLLNKSSYKTLRVGVSDGHRSAKIYLPPDSISTLHWTPASQL